MANNGGDTSGHGKRRVRQRQKSRSTRPETVNEIKRLYFDEEMKSPSEIYRELQKPGSPFADTVSARTINRIVREDIETNEVHDNSGEWQALDAIPEDAALVLDVLTHVMTATKTRKTSFTNAEAERIIWFRRAYPDMPLDDVWRETRRLLRYELRNEPDDDKRVAGIVTNVAYTRWRGPEHEARYWEMAQHHTDKVREYQRKHGLNELGEPVDDEET